MRRWILPAALGIALAILSGLFLLHATPSFLMGVAMGRLDKAGVNLFAHGPLASDKSRAIVRPSPDLAYSSCPFDLSKGPVLIDVAPAPAPYWSLSVFDRRTDVAFVRNNRDSRGGAIRIALAREGQQVPAGIEAVRLDDDRGIALVRILVESKDRFAAIDKARRASVCRPL
ncbi:MAG TPA: DUF1254 domain-containing protein [Allosphingosinicella sp.]